MVYRAILTLRLGQLEDNFSTAPKNLGAWLNKLDVAAKT
jgi:hypothetical protein